MSLKRCRHAAKYKATRAPRCGCEACESKYVARLARAIWRYPEDAREGQHTVRAVLQLAHILPER